MDTHILRNAVITEGWIVQYLKHFTSEERRKKEIHIFRIVGKN